MDDENFIILKQSSVERMEGVFKAARSSQMFISVYEDATRYILGGNWNNFDEVYLALYAISLAPRAETMITSSAKDGEIQLEAFLDIDLVNHNSKKGVLDEFAVHDVIRFKERLFEALPRSSKISSFGIGCVVMGVSVPVSGGYAEVEDGIEIFKSRVEARLAGNEWEKLVKRFHVTGLNLL